MITWSAGLTVVASASTLILPYFTKLYIDRVYPTHDEELLSRIVLLVAAISITAAIVSAVKGLVLSLTMVQIRNATAPYCSSTTFSDCP